MSFPTTDKLWQGSHSPEGHGRLWRWWWGGPLEEALLLSLSMSPADDAQGPMEGPFVFLFFSPKNCNTNIGISCFPNLRTRALLSKQSAELDLGAPHRSKSPPEEGDKERDLGRGWGGGLRHLKATHKTRSEVPGKDGKIHGHSSFPLRAPSQLPPAV